MDKVDKRGEVVEIIKKVTNDYIPNEIPFSWEIAVADPILAWLENELGEQQKINNLVLADKCDELDKIVAKFQERIKPIREAYARWEHLDEPMSVKVEKTDIRFDILNDLWQAIKQVLEDKDEKES